MKKAELEELIKKQTKEIEDLKKLLAAKVEAPVIKSEPKELKLSGSSNPVPTDYLEAVKTTLNSNFGVQVNALSDRPAFEFIISVPKKYSNAPKPHWQTYGNDLRPKVISYAEGLNGVKDWLKKVWDNFDPDTRTKISLDRVTV